jgi:ASC-1-like (ASCH) protein
MHQGSYVVSDGFHRVTAARQAGRTTLNAYVRSGTTAEATLEEAWLRAMETNIRHGMPYTREDRQKIVHWFLDHPRYGKLPIRDIAKLTGNMVPPSTVANIRNRRKLQDLQALSNLDEVSPRVPSVHEQLRQMDQAYSRMRNAAAVIIGVAQQMSDAPKALAPCVLAAQESLARLAQVLEEMQDAEDA